jgi:hypothetical protein
MTVIPPSPEVQNEDLLRRITKLLNLSSNNPSENEAEAAMVKAQEMMLGYGITMADIANFDGESRTKIEATYAEYTCDTGLRTPSWRAILGWRIAKAMGGEAIRTASYGVKAHGTFVPGKITFFALGDESLEAMIEVYRYIELQLDLMSAKATRTRPPQEIFDWKTGEYKMVRKGGQAYRLAWIVGAIERLRERLQEQYDRIASEGDNGKALVLVRDVIKDKVNEVYGGQIVYRRGRQRHYRRDAYAAGRAAADNIDLGGAKLGEGRLGLPA